MQRLLPVGPHSRSAFERFVFASLTLKLLDQIRTLVQFFSLRCVCTFPWGSLPVSFDHDQFRQIVQTN